MKDIVAEEDRCKNLVLFGLTEDLTEQTSDKVGKVFEVLGVEPKVDAIRIGSKARSKLQNQKSLSLQFHDRDSDS